MHSPDAIAVSIVSDAVLAPRVAIILNDRALAAVLKTSHPQLLLAMSLRDQVRRCPGGACVGLAWGVRGACVGRAWGVREACDWRAWGVRGACVGRA